MPTPRERRALIFIAALAALGVVARGCREVRAPSGGAAVIVGDRAGLARQIEAVDSAIAAGGERRRGRGAREKDVASRRATTRTAAAAPPDEPPQHPEMPPEWPPKARYPKSWLAQVPPPRDPHEAYRQRWERADSVRRLINERDGVVSPRPSTARRATAPAVQSASPGVRAPVDLDTAPLEEIASLAQVGPALARRIVSDRIERGPFGSIGGLERVRGISRALARRLQPYVTFSLASRLESVPEASVPVRRRRRP